LGVSLCNLLQKQQHQTAPSRSYRNAHMQEQRMEEGN
jgi:hypothetical protein